ncbi:MAG: methylmalonyl Co-A mutase-associated GTPase MeaB [Nitriliruptoraceae bacterium]
MIDPKELVANAKAGDRRALARLLTVVEDADPKRLRQIIADLYADTGTARVIGITGSPGVGKSTLTNALAMTLRKQQRRVAILAIDPSSPFSGGALLGDRVRMQAHHGDPDVYIRSMASRGHLGGLSLATPQAVLVLDAVGFDDIIIETVGVGQSEVDIAATADSTLVVLAPGMGDGVQAAKAGILEIADVLVINKSDHMGADRLHSELAGMLDIAKDGAIGELSPWTPPIARCVGIDGEGVAALVGIIDDHGTHLDTTSFGEDRRRQRAVQLLRELVLDAVRRRFIASDDDSRSVLTELARKVAARELDPYTASDQLLADLDLVNG